MHVTPITDLDRDKARRQLRAELGREPGDVEVLMRAVEIVEARMDVSRDAK